MVDLASNKLNLEFRGMTLEDAKAKLIRHGLAPATADQYEQVIQLCDFGQFAGEERDEKAWKEALDAAEALLRKMDREL